MRGFLIFMLVLTVVEVIFYLALPALLRLRDIDAKRVGPFGLRLVFETEDEDGTPVRLVNVNGTFQSATYLSDELWSELVCVYHRQMVEVINAMGDARSVLVIGGGGYSLPKYLVTHTKRMRVCVVEIDPAMTELARERFFLDRAESAADGRLELVSGDGFAWLESCEQRFDVIVNDAFSAGKPLKKLATEDGARLIANHLTERGVYLANIRCPLEGPRAGVVPVVKAAFGTAFAHVRMIAENPEEPRRLGNNVLVATNRALGDELGRVFADRA